MRLAVFGGGGMLGREVALAAEQAGLEVATFTRAQCDIADPGQVANALELARAQAAINCAGVVKNAPTWTDWGSEVMRVNGLGPWMLAEGCTARGIHLVHVSTDCVFSGREPGTRVVSERPDPIDLYGRSKLAAEGIVDMPGIAVVRTSFIGREHGLWRWFVDEAGRQPPELIPAWSSARWSGSTVDVIAAGLVRLAAEKVEGLQHLAMPIPSSKADVLTWINEALALRAQLIPIRLPSIYRGLAPTVPLEGNLRDAIRRYARR